MSPAPPVIPDLPSLVPPLLDMCSRAGALICRHYRSPGDAGVRAKGDDSPLTQADLDSHDLLLRELATLTPDIPVLSEESGSDDMVRRREWSSRIPYGPYIALGAIAWMFGGQAIFEWWVSGGWMSGPEIYP